MIKAVIIDLMFTVTWMIVVILELTHAPKSNFTEGLCLLEAEPITGLILPLFRCLTGRLSHACLSISLYTVKLQSAH